ncbi:MAG: hypothetical protein ACRD68_11470 [Pyrinomonadaceae bacterium]
MTPEEKGRSAGDESDAIERERLAWIEAEDSRLLERRKRRERELEQKKSVKE